MSRHNQLLTPNRQIAEVILMPLRTKKNINGYACSANVFVLLYAARACRRAYVHHAHNGQQQLTFVLQQQLTVNI